MAVEHLQHQVLLQTVVELEVMVLQDKTVQLILAAEEVALVFQLQVETEVQASLLFDTL